MDRSSYSEGGGSRVYRVLELHAYDFYSPDPLFGVAETEKLGAGNINKQALSI